MLRLRLILELPTHDCLLREKCVKMSEEEEEAGARA